MWMGTPVHSKLKTPGSEMLPMAWQALHCSRSPTHSSIISSTSASFLTLMYVDGSDGSRYCTRTRLPASSSASGPRSKVCRISLATSYGAGVIYLEKRGFNVRWMTWRAISVRIILLATS